MHDKRSLMTRRLFTGLIWGAVVCAMALPFGIAMASPYLEGRDAVYIIAGFAGILALALLLIQPLLAARYLPGFHLTKERRWHRWIGGLIVLGVAVHIGGLYLTSPADALDALLLASPTPFSIYGVIGMWGIILTAVLVAFRSWLKIPYRWWNIVHNALACVVVVASVVHALMIEGTMGTVSKTVLCALVLTATAFAVVHFRIVKPYRRKQQGAAKQP